MISRFLAKIVAGDKERILYFAWQRGKEEEDDDDEEKTHKEILFISSTLLLILDILATFNFWAFGP